MKKLNKRARKWRTNVKKVASKVIGIMCREQYKDLKISKLSWDGDELTVWFSDVANPDEPFCVREFKKNSRTWKVLSSMTTVLQGIPKFSLTL